MGLRTIGRTRERARSRALSLVANKGPTSTGTVVAVEDDETDSTSTGPTAEVHAPPVPSFQEMFDEEPPSVSISRAELSALRRLVQEQQAQLQQLAGKATPP